MRDENRPEITRCKKTYTERHLFMPIDDTALIKILEKYGLKIEKKISKNETGKKKFVKEEKSDSSSGGDKPRKAKKTYPKHDPTPLEDDDEYVGDDYNV